MKNIFKKKVKIKICIFMYYIVVSCIESFFFVSIILNNIICMNNVDKGIHKCENYF